MTQVTKDIIFYTHALKTPRIAKTFQHMIDMAKDQGWSMEEFLAAVLETEVSARQAAGIQNKLQRAHFPYRKTMEEFDFDYQPQIRNEILPNASGAYIAKAENIILLGPPGTGKTHLAVSLGMKAIEQNTNVLFNTAQGWIETLQTAHNHAQLAQALKRLKKYPLLIIDEFGYLPIDADAANLFFQHISDRYEQGSLIITSNLPFSQWGEILGSTTRATAIIDRVVHHAQVLQTSGKSYRLRNHDQPNPVK